MAASESGIRWSTAHTLRVRGRTRTVQAGAILLDWDPFASPILSEVRGSVIEFGDIIEARPCRSRWTSSRACPPR